MAFKSTVCSKARLSAMLRKNQIISAKQIWFVKLLLSALSLCEPYFERQDAHHIIQA